MTVSYSLTSSREEGHRVLDELARAFDTGSPDHLQLDITRESWIARWWWDTVPARLRLYLVGNVDDADRDVRKQAERMDPDVRAYAIEALTQEVDRRVATPWLNPGIPGKKTRKTDVREPEVAVPGGRRLRFEDRIDIKPARKSRRRT